MRIYEVNTALLRTPLEDVDWSFVPDVDAVWLMGVWERSPAGMAIALDDPGLMAGMRAAVPDLRADDVIGSPYCVRDYVVDPRFGDLAAARAKLAERGLKLILDYVPNHVAPDHPWVPEHCIRGTEEDLARDPVSWLRVGDAIVARGRDPYFPAWPDVVQLDAFSPGLRAAARELLAHLATLCDGVRCDMAMLMTNEVFARTWHREPPPTEFWPDVFDDRLTFIAEAYWDMEWALHQQGFDYAYDKRLYDRLAHEDAASVRAHLAADASYLLRFIENHDEPRAAAVFGERARAAAVILATVPGGKLYHHGQFDGARVKVPVFLARGPVEAPDDALHEFYSRIVGLRVTDWRLLDTDHPQLLAWAFSDHVVAVNFGPTELWSRIRVDLDAALTDVLTGLTYERSGPELIVGLPPWGAHLFTVS
ncbi:alpha-amylase family glycosyl hydrolase [Solirubrobacter soli]|uniref:alpha-amylase family glycosyl hydrolase n=1 Tax=Solirubrobacter soli TaxID=363832 RepID=UPI00041431D4|nr:alpha-amylase family glycosyl hydrolase [Solirubrobacter soli]